MPFKRDINQSLLVVHDFLNEPLLKLLLKGRSIHEIYRKLPCKLEHGNTE